MRNMSALSSLLFFLIAASGVAAGWAFYGALGLTSGVFVVAGLVVAVIVAVAVKVASPWDRAVVLRLGRFRSLSGPGLFTIIPVIDSIAYWIDVRVLTSSFKAEKTLTKDTVPVGVDAVLFWKVTD